MNFHPFCLLLFSFLLLILVGSVLFVLPVSTVDGQHFNYLDALLLATSSVTITGLNPVADLGQTLTIFGKIVLTILIQVSGLGVVTFGVFIMILIGTKITFSERVIVKENLNNPSIGRVVSLIKRILILTFSIEFIGFLLNLIVFLPLFDVPTALGYSAFHAISSFNNAGFVLWEEAEFYVLANNYLFIFNTSLLIILGGLGFIVLIDIFKFRGFKKFSVHSKIVLSMNLILWIGGAIFIKLGQIYGPSISVADSIFLSINARTAGFNHENIMGLRSITLLILIILMFIGGAPSSTAGGIKVTTFFTLFKTMRAYALGKEVNAFKREIHPSSRQKAFILFFMYIGIITFCAALLLAFDNVELGQSIFIATSAITNVGYSTVLTQALSVGSRLTLIVVMFVGRVGPLTFLAVLNKNWYKPISRSISYLEEKIIIG